MIRPICITILYHNLPLFIDIFLIKRCYLCLFICFCMLDDSWRMYCRSQDSDGKRGVLMQFREDQKNTRKTMENHIFPEYEECQKGGRRWAIGDAHPPGAGHPQAEPTGGVAHLAHLWIRPLAYIFPSKP